MKTVKKISYILVLVGALNWGLVGLIGLDLVAALFGDMTAVSRLVYALVGLSAVVVIFKNKKCSSCNSCNTCGDVAKPATENK